MQDRPDRPRFKSSDQAFGVSVEDVLQSGPIYIPMAGLLVSQDASPASLKDYVAKIQDEKTLLEKVREMPEQTFPQALEAVHIPIQDHGPMMLSLACDERKFVALREGPLCFTLDDQPKCRVRRDNRSQNAAMSLQLHCVLGNGSRENVTRHLDGEWLPIPVTTVNEKRRRLSNAQLRRPARRHTAPRSTGVAPPPGRVRDRIHRGKHAIRSGRGRPHALCP